MTDFNGFKGRAKRIDDIDLPKIGAQIGVGEDELHAFIDVETLGSGFDEEGRPRILFERHIFHRYLTPAERKKAGALANPNPGGYGKSSEQYGKLAKAMAINEKAALFACSWGLGQVMGFNHKAAGFGSVQDMVRSFMDDEENQLQGSVNFIVTNGLDDELRNHNWAGFAKGYNGPNYAINKYDQRLAEAYAKWSRIKDTSYTPGQTEPTPEPVPEQPQTSSGFNGWVFGGIVLAAVAAIVTKYLGVW